MITPLNFREPGHSGTGHGCVEVAGSHTGTAVRDSEHSVEGAAGLPLDRVGLAHQGHHRLVAGEDEDTDPRFGVAVRIPPMSASPYGGASLTRDATHLSTPHVDKCSCISLSRIDSVFSYPDEGGLDRKRSANIRFRRPRSPPCEPSESEASILRPVR